MPWPSGQDSSYVKLTYKRVRDHFDAVVHLHQTAILVGIIFSKTLPDVCHNIKAPAGTLIYDITQVVRAAPWIPTGSQNCKEMTSQAPFIIMMSTFIITIYEPTSPLHQYMSSYKNNLGQLWTKKNIVCSVSFLHPRSLTSLLDAKKITLYVLALHEQMVLESSALQNLVSYGLSSVSGIWTYSMKT